MGSSTDKSDKLFHPTICWISPHNLLAIDIERVFDGSPQSSMAVHSFDLFERLAISPNSCLFPKHDPQSGWVSILKLLKLWHFFLWCVCVPPPNFDPFLTKVTSHWNLITVFFFLVKSYTISTRIERIEWIYIYTFPKTNSKAPEFLVLGRRLSITFLLGHQLSDLVSFQ